MGNRPRILVCGGRDFGHVTHDMPEPLKIERLGQYQCIMSILEHMCLCEGWHSQDDYRMPDVEIISGMATGADSVAVDWAVTNWLKVHKFPADWKTHGKAAGHIRNQQMIDEGKPDLVVAFPGGKGTADMVKRAKKAGIKVIEVVYDG